MTHLAKLTFKTVDRSMKRDPIIARRDKLMAGLKEQKLVHAVTLKKEDHLVERSRNLLGECHLNPPLSTLCPHIFCRHFADKPIRYAKSE